MIAFAIKFAVSVGFLNAPMGFGTIGTYSDSGVKGEDI